MIQETDSAGFVTDREQVANHRLKSIEELQHEHYTSNATPYISPAKGENSNGSWLSHQKQNNEYEKFHIISGEELACNPDTVDSVEPDE